MAGKRQKEIFKTMSLPSKLPTHEERQPSLKLEAPVKIDERRTPELVIGLVGPIGAGVSSTVSRLEKLIISNFGYEVQIVKASQCIAQSAHIVGMRYDNTLHHEGHIRSLQDIGNKLREDVSENFVIEKCIEKIAKLRNERGFEKNQSGVDLPKPLRVVHIIDSLKNPSECGLLKKVYGDLFWLLAVFVPADLRKSRLQMDGYHDPFLTEVFSRDEYEEEKFGQKVRDTSYLADFFVRNDGQNTDELAAR